MIHFQYPSFFGLYFLLIPLFFLMKYGQMMKKKDLNRFTGGLGSEENDFQFRGFRLSSILAMTSVVFIIMALTRPSWNQETRTVEKKGHDVVFLIDVSRSMLADDLIPNRLERAKLAVIDAVQSLDGDRAALVAFAGSAVVKAPLTNDYSFFISAVKKLKVDSVTKGGSLIGDALRYTMENVLDESSLASRDIILITDGEDQESYPLEAAADAGKEGIRIIAIGLGNEKEGQRIPVETDNGTEFLSYDGQEVWSRLDAHTLRKIAGSTDGGRYLNVSTGTFDLAEIYKTLKTGRKEVFQAEEEITIYEERFQFFLFLAILFAALSLFQPFRGLRHLISKEDLSKIRKLVRR